MSDRGGEGVAGALRVGAAHRVDVEVAVAVAVVAALQQRAALGQGCNLSRQGAGSNTLNKTPFTHVRKSERPAEHTKGRSHCYVTLAQHDSPKHW